MEKGPRGPRSVVARALPAVICAFHRMFWILLAGCRFGGRLFCPPICHVVTTEKHRYRGKPAILTGLRITIKRNTAKKVVINFAQGK